MSDRQATQDFTIFNVLINHTGKVLTPALVNQIRDEIIKEMREGPCAWSFGDKSE